MFEPFDDAGTDQLVRDRIRALQEIANGLHAVPRPDTERTTPVLRLRGLLGRRLISIGSSVAGQQAS